MKIKRKSIMMVFIVLFALAPITLNPSNASIFMAASPSNPYGGAAIDPLPATATIFSVTNGKKTINYSKNSLLAIKSTIITIQEPFVKKKQSFTVIPLDYFLAKSAITSSMTIDTIALNDYIYTNKAGNFSQAKAYLAFKRFGKDIPYNEGGPIRIVFDTPSSWFKYLDAWNWSLRTIKVKKTA